MRAWGWRKRGWGRILRVALRRWVGVLRLWYAKGTTQSAKSSALADVSDASVRCLEAGIVVWLKRRLLGLSFGKGMRIFFPRIISPRVSLRERGLLFPRLLVLSVLRYSWLKGIALETIKRLPAIPGYRICRQEVQGTKEGGTGMRGRVSRWDCTCRVSPACASNMSSEVGNKVDVAKGESHGSCCKRDVRHRNMMKAPFKEDEK